jgi:ATP-dependent protease ClpP protease subunit
MADSIHLRRLADLVDSTAVRIVEQATEDGVPVAELPAMRLRWYRIGETRAAGEGTTGRDGQPVRTEANVYVYDRIGGSLGVNAEQFAADLEQVDADVIQLRVNSPGGSVMDAKAIMNTLRAHPAYVHGHVDGMAASAATLVLMGSDVITMEPGAELMVHRASTEASGDDVVLQPVVDWIRRQTEDIADLYAQRSGRPADEWDKLMTAETWFYGQEAVDYGLADRAERLTRPPASEEEAGMAERMRRRHSLRGYRYDGRAAAGPPNAARRTATPVAAARGSTTRRRVPSEVRDAAQLRRRALDRGMMQRSAPAGIATAARRSAPSGDITHEMVELRGRPMYRTHGAFTVYGRPYEMWDMYGPYHEKVYAGSGAQTIGMRDLDCVFLMNHTGMTMARTAGPWNDYRGTLTLQEKPDQGWHEAFHNPARPDVQMMISGIDDRLITEMSYAFLIVDGRWNDDMTEYGIYLYDMNRGDVSAVNYGANPYTDITARASEILDELGQMPAGAISEAVRILSKRVGAYEQLLREADPGALARIAEPALEQAREQNVQTVSPDDKATAMAWAAQAIDGAEQGPKPDPEQVEDAEIIDKTGDQGHTVAAWEALASSAGIKLPQ